MGETQDAAVASGLASTVTAGQILATIAGYGGNMVII
jgi:hypothetical protein